MAPSNPPSSRPAGTVTKLPAIPKGARVEKRPLTRRQPPASSKARIIYVSARTPLMAVVKRARKQLEAADKSTGAAAGAAPKNASVHARIEALQRAGAGGNNGGVDSSASGGGGSVTLMGTGRAVERTLAVASWFEQQADCGVEVRTRTVATVDDIVVEDGDVEDESRLRKMSCLEVVIKLK